MASIFSSLNILCFPFSISPPGTSSVLQRSTCLLIQNPPSIEESFSCNEWREAGYLGLSISVKVGLCHKGKWSCRIAANVRRESWVRNRMELDEQDKIHDFVPILRCIALTTHLRWINCFCIHSYGELGLYI